MIPAPAELAAVAGRIADAVRAALLERPDAAGGETLLDPADLKSGHLADRTAIEAARRALAGHACNLFIEGERTAADPAAAFCVYLDPLDGSLNWDRGVGDPAFVLAAAAGPSAATLDDLAFAFVAGLRSGDRYWLEPDGARFAPGAGTGINGPLACDAPSRVEAATGYLRLGYGGAARQLARTRSLLLAARDLRAFDNAGIEFAEVARGAAHFMVEARGISDGFNLLAWPIARAAGCVLTDLAGNHLGPAPFDPAAPVDYVLAGNDTLGADVTSRIDPATDAT